jgi:hypothetical protein
VLAFLFAAALAAGCSSSSSSPLPIPLKLPSLVAGPAAETLYAGKLVHVRPGLGPTLGWRIQNANAVGSVPVDVSKVEDAAKSLSGQIVQIKGHSFAEPGGRLVLLADSLTAYTPQ